MSTEAGRPASEENVASGSLGRRLLLMLPVAAFVALAVLFAVRLFSGDPSRLPSALIGRPVPATTLAPLPGLTDPAGRPLPGLESRDLATGRVTIVNVWASWCGPCQIEHPVLMELAKGGSATLVGFNYKDKPEAARRFLAALGNPFTAVGVDPTGKTAIDWGVYGVPETFVIGPDGTIRYKHVGPLTPESAKVLLNQVRAAERPRSGGAQR